MKGHKPFLCCKKQVETSNKNNHPFLELGVKQETQCNCKKDECKNKDNEK